MKEKFEDRKTHGDISINLGNVGFWNCRKETIISNISAIVDDYQEQGFVLTLRQLYYQLVSKDMIPNHLKVYKKISSIKNDMCYAGLLDWSAIEDRGRVIDKPYFENDVNDAIYRTIQTYKLDRQKNQDTHVELWCEKDAISNIIKSVTYRYGIPVMINKGYSSSSAMYSAYRRIRDEIESGREVVILYLGDHDPSGLDMIRDIRERISFFLQNSEYLNNDYRLWVMENKLELYEKLCHVYPNIETDLKKLSDKSKQKSINRFLFTAFLSHSGMFNVKQIGLNMHQIEAYSLPENPAKITDPRAGSYIEQFGRSSWELDALSPSILQELIEENILDNISIKSYHMILREEKADINELKKLINQNK